MNIDINVPDGVSLDLTPQKEVEIEVKNGDTSKAIQKHNMDESAHPFILNYINNRIGDIEQALSEV